MVIVVVVIVVITIEVVMIAIKSFFFDRGGQYRFSMRSVLEAKATTVWRCRHRCRRSRRGCRWCSAENGGRCGGWCYAGGCGAAVVVHEEIFGTATVVVVTHKVGFHMKKLGREKE